MVAESNPDLARRLARLSLAFEDVAAVIRRGAEAGGLTLSEVRLLDGIARGVTGARLLSRRLGLDEGHVSRMVKRLRQARLISTRRQEGDGRRVELDLTEAGATRLEEAIAGAAAAATAALGDEMSASAAAVGGALSALLDGGSPAAQVELGALAPGDAGWVIAQHGQLYALEEDFDHSFEAEVARVVADYLAASDAAREAAWIARAGAERVGCVFCVAAEGDGDMSAQLRLFLVRPEWRRRGLGQQLLDTCRAFAADAGYRELILYTHMEHKAAGRLYEAYGFTRTDSRKVTAYGRRMTEQIWALPLDGPLANGRGRG